MAPQKYPLDRSAAFTALLELDPEGFGKQDMKSSDATISEFLEDWYAADSASMWDYAGQWLERRREAAQRLPDAPGQEAPIQWSGHPSMKLPDEPRSLEDRASGGDWQVTAQVHREIDGCQSSRQVPAFTIPRWAAPTRGDAEAKAREIMNPYGERYDITMDVWSQDGPQGEPEADRAGVGPGDDPRQDLQAVADYYEGQTARVRPLEKPSDIPGERQPGARQAERGE